MAISYVAAGTAGQDTAPVPAGIANNDILIVVTNGGPASFSGWTAFTASASPLRCHWKRTTGSESTLTTTGALVSRMYAFRGVSLLSDPVDAQPSTASSANNVLVTCAAITTLTSNTMVCAVSAYAADASDDINYGTPTVTRSSGTPTTNAGVSNRKIFSSPDWQGWVCYLGYGPLVSPGTTGTTGLTATQNHNPVHYGFNLALRDAASDPATNPRNLMLLGIG